jgi:hypothetical protein
MRAMLRDRHSRRLERWAGVLRRLPAWCFWPVLVLDTALILAFPLVGGLLFFALEGGLHSLLPSHPTFEGWPRTVSFWVVVALFVMLESWLGGRLDDRIAKRRAKAP